MAENPAGASTGPDQDEGRPMGRVYASVLLVELITLFGLWWFQSAFS